jgi:hypothetical protein
VIIIAVIFIVISSIIYIIIGVLGASIPGVVIGDVDDDEITALWDDGLLRLAIFSGISLIFSIAALVGARTYNIWLVGSNIIWLLVSYIASIIISIVTIDEINAISPDDTEFGYDIRTYVISGLYTILFMYPHIGFIHEVKSGIMSAETYPREESSCCCVTQRRM